MRRDPKVFVLGEDVASMAARLASTAGIFDEFGEARCLDTPISESAIIGVSIGASQRGYRPVAEMQFADFISCGFDQIVNQAATLRYRTEAARRARSSCARRAAATSAAGCITRRIRRRGSFIAPG